MENSTRSPFQSSHLDDFPWLCLTCPLIHAGANSLNIEKEIVIFLRYRKKWNKKSKERLERGNFRPFSNPVVTFSPPTRNNLFFFATFISVHSSRLYRERNRENGRGLRFTRAKMENLDERTEKKEDDDVMKIEIFASFFLKELKRTGWGVDRPNHSSPLHRDYLQEKCMTGLVSEWKDGRLSRAKKKFEKSKWFALIITVISFASIT